MKNAQKLLEKISHEKIHPIPKWYFLLKNIFFWGIGILFIGFGIISFALLLDQIFETDPEIISYISHVPHTSHISFLLDIIPFFWIFFALLFLGFSYFGVTHTKKGYKYSLLQIWSGSILISIILGSGVYFSGYAENIEKNIATSIYFYHSNEERRKKIWNHPESGFLSGKIQEIFPDKKQIILTTWEGSRMGILYKDAIIRGPEGNKILTKGSTIKIIGELKELGEISGNKKNIFKASEIRPWKKTSHNKENHEKVNYKKKHLEKRQMHKERKNTKNHKKSETK